MDQYGAKQIPKGNPKRTNGAKGTTTTFLGLRVRRQAIKKKEEEDDQQRLVQRCQLAIQDSAWIAFVSDFMLKIDR